MARRQTERLNQVSINRLAHKERFQPGYHADGNGLYLHIGQSGTASWIFRYMLNGRAREMGVGALHTVGLGKARELAQEARLQKFLGSDPLDLKAAEKARKAAEAAAAVSFKTAAEGYVKAHKAAWRNKLHAWQWTATLETHVYPVIGSLPVRDVETGHVTKILEPIWSTKTETATRIRGRIEVVLDYAKTHGWRSGENPARWKGHLENVLPARTKVAKVKHHAALPWREIGAFMKTLEPEPGMATLALRFTILTAGRTNEVIGARWNEFDMRAAIWTVPPERMKAGKEHRVPLSEQALALLGEAEELRQGNDPTSWIFPGGKGGKGLSGLSNMAMLSALKRIGRTDLTVHGFRSTFRDWAAETTGYQNEVVEAALAHTIESKVEAAYRRGDLFEKRRRLMNDWAAFCNCVAPVEVKAAQMSGEPL
jgi:integrase